MGHLTHDSAPLTTRSVVIYVPDDDRSIHEVLWYLYNLGQAETWEQYGTKTPDEMAQAWSAAYDDTEAAIINP